MCTVVARVLLAVDIGLGRHSVKAGRMLSSEGRPHVTSEVERIVHHAQATLWSCVSVCLGVPWGAHVGWLQQAMQVGLLRLDSAGPLDTGQRLSHRWPQWRKTWTRLALCRRRSTVLLSLRSQWRIYQQCSIWSNPSSSCGGTGEHQHW